MTRQATVSLIPTKPLSGPLVGVTSVCAGFLVERRGFEPLTSAVHAPARLTGVFVQFGAAFENLPQTGKDRLVGAAGRFVDFLPIAYARLAREAANEGLEGA
jgi:hypothetical protein